MYSEIEHKSSILVQLMQLIYQSQEEDWKPYYNFMVLPVPSHVLDMEPFFVELAKKRKFHAGILLTNPNSCYNWHVDTDRKASINMLVLDGNDSKCLFAREYGITMPIHELKYKPFTYYVFNTQLPHMVLNFSEPRYLFSLEFLGEDKGITYDELCEEIQGLNYGS